MGAPGGVTFQILINLVDCITSDDANRALYLHCPVEDCADVILTVALPKGAWATSSRTNTESGGHETCFSGTLRDIFKLLYPLQGHSAAWQDEPESSRGKVTDRLSRATATATTSQQGSILGEDGVSSGSPSEGSTIPLPLAPHKEVMELIRSRTLFYRLVIGISCDPKGFPH